ncbi:hypothetical protein NPIL_286341 [Nephila pilipes]|uniref:Uncharacterized protein n=1 Tax=Nephila pilipes TaxID=299642 RepID=A0A8X6UW39_NEPPI|nr:hypothetical protein NPIL_286341 [Nephila pilipes]
MRKGYPTLDQYQALLLFCGGISSASIFKGGKNELEYFRVTSDSLLHLDGYVLGRNSVVLEFSRPPEDFSELSLPCPCTTFGFRSLEMDDPSTSLILQEILLWIFFLHLNIRFSDSVGPHKDKMTLSDGHLFKSLFRCDVTSENSGKGRKLPPMRFNRFVSELQFCCRLYPFPPKYGQSRIGSSLACVGHSSAFLQYSLCRHPLLLWQFQRKR